MEVPSFPVRPRSRTPRALPILLVLSTLVMGILIGTVVSRGVKGKENPASDATPLQLPAPQQLSSAFSQVARKIEPSVVNINTTSTLRPQRKGRRAPNPGDEEGGDPFQDFFDRFFGGPQGGPNAQPDGVRQRSLGSGVIVDPKGYIVTNAHVVERADRIQVTLYGDPSTVQYDAKVVGVDKETDLAVIKIEVNKPLPAAKLGNSDSVDVGDWVLAVGSPFGLEQTVTAGIISSKGRTIDNSRQFQSFLQTDAAINPGNSGGPLVNMNGEVIGINTAIYTQSYGSQGVGFALPSKTVVNVYNQLIGPGNKVTRGSIGIVFGAIPNPAVQRMYGGGSGVVISSVAPNGPAEQAGLKTGDTIVSVDGKKVTNGDDLVSEIAARKPGTKAELGYIRDGKEQKVTVTIADRAKLFPDASAETASDESAAPEAAKLGLSVRVPTPDQVSRLGLTAGKGLIVTEVKPGSFAEDIGLTRGMVILEINRKSLSSEEDFRKVTAQLKSGDDVVFLIRDGRNSGTLFLGGTLP
jgi:serine protease Do